VPLRCLYTDLDGTLLGRGASLVHDANGDFTLLGVRALEACHRADVEVVIFSGRREAQVHEDARLMGSTSYIFEIGAGLVVDGEREWLTDGLEPTPEASIHDQLTEAADILLERFEGRLEYHAPWHTNREVSHLFRGRVDVAEADDILRAARFAHARLVDNGAIHRQSPTLRDDLGRLHAYHLVPVGASKARAVARHMQIRGYAPEETIAVGDSREDLEASAAVGTFWLVANAVEKDPTLREAIGGRENVRVAEESHGAGVYEAVVTTLAKERG
jgi:hydroxymethylpyrimidine pyrophosphatase-like HAD family hydrolase